MDIENFEFGLDTFGDLARTDAGQLMTYGAAIRQIVDEAELADKLGISVIALGEHHRDEFTLSSPEIVLAAMAMKTKNIKLATGTTVLSSDDPVRVYERFATLDALSNGRAQLIAGRGSFTESFPLFGYNLANYDALFEEKLAMFMELRKEKPMNWQGQFTQSLQDTDVFPKTEKGKLDTWIAVGGSPESVIRTARYGLPLILAIIGGDAIRFKPYVELYQRATEEMGTESHPVAVHSHGVVADTDEEAYQIAWDNVKMAFDKIGRTRGWSTMSKEHFEQEIEQGAMYVGTPEKVAQKLAKTIKDLGIGRFDLVYGAGEQKASDRVRTIELYATKVIPRVKELLAEA